MAAPDQPAHGRPGHRCVAGDDRISDERVADPVERANHAAIARRIAECFAKLRDERRKARFRDMNAGPERRMQLLVRTALGWFLTRISKRSNAFGARRMSILPPHQVRADVDDNRTHTLQSLADYTRASSFRSAAGGVPGRVVAYLSYEETRSMDAPLES